MDETRASKLIKGKRPLLKQWIGRDPTYLLDHLDSNELIPRDKYLEALDIAGKAQRANFLIDDFIGRDECLVLIKALVALQDKYPQLKGWFSEIQYPTAGAVSVQLPEALPAVSPPPAPVASSFEAKLQACGDDKELQRRIVPLTPQLVQALQGDLLPILNELRSKEVITAAEKDKVKARSNSGGAAAATELLDIVEQKGRREARKFWLALWATRDTYTRLLDIFDEF
uniref:Uncharacterized protein LOC116956964 n=1 Tax=Petromyzon marinus TaxID=7757 RepID=A0AAJ7UE30_PETMA|nr:uncharacterized protein LOC116956964 [Petromyzon marinus]XP_032834746.1 uncharacterized protein LOC116956964 [Petromyzon marinus]